MASRFDSSLVCAGCSCYCVLKWKRGRHHAVFGKAFWFLTVPILWGYDSWENAPNRVRYEKWRNKTVPLKEECCRACSVWLSGFQFLPILGGYDGKPCQTSSGMKETKRCCFAKIETVPGCVWCSFLAVRSCLPWAAGGKARQTDLILWRAQQPQPRQRPHTDFVFQTASPNFMSIS